MTYSRSPAACEGFGVSCELADATDAPGAEVVQRPELRSLDLDAGRPPRSGVPNPANHLFSDRASIDFHARIGPSVEITLYMAAKSLTAQVHTATGKFGRVVVLDLGVEELDPVIQVASVERGLGLPHDLDVLLRHRLLPQPGGFEHLLLRVEVENQPTTLAPVVAGVGPQPAVVRISKGRLQLDDDRRVVLPGFRGFARDGAVAPVAAAEVVSPNKLRLRSRPDLYAEDARVLDVASCQYLGWRPESESWAIRFPSDPANAAAPTISTTASDVPPIAKTRFKTRREGWHVLLRHRLLPQPGGFEGFGFAGVHAERRSLAVAHRYEVCKSGPRWRVRWPGAQRGNEHCEDSPAQEAPRSAWLEVHLP